MTRPQKLTDDACRQAIEETRRLLVVLDRDLLNARRHAADFAAVGYSNGNTDPGGTSDISRPTEAAVLAQEHTDPDTGRTTWKQDPTAFYPDKLRNAINNLRTAVADAHRAVTVIESHGTDPDKDDDTNARRPALGAGACKVCDHYCTGVDGDRLRSGLCDRHRKQWERQRSDYHDRGDWILTERRALKQAVPKLGT